MGALDSQPLPNQAGNCTLFLAWFGFKVPMLSASHWILSCQLLHKLLQQTEKSGHFPKANKLITQKMPKPDFMVFLKAGAIFVCCQSSDVFDLEVHWLNFFLSVSFSLDAWSFHVVQFPLAPERNLADLGLEDTALAFFKLPWVHYIYWFMWEMVTLPWWGNKNTQVWKDKATEDTMVMSFLKCSSHFRNNTLHSDQVISGDRE